MQMNHTPENADPISESLSSLFSTSCIHTVINY